MPSIIEADHRAPPPRESLPEALLYAIAAPVGGHGLGTTAAFSLRPSAEAGILRGVVAISSDRKWTGRARVRDLAFHPVRLARLLLDSGASMQARKQVVARMAARWIRSGGFDCFHGWSGEALDAFVAARKLGLPCLLDIPTWHRDKGERKPFLTRSDRFREAPWFEVTRQHEQAGCEHQQPRRGGLDATKLARLLPVSVVRLVQLLAHTSST